MTHSPSHQCDVWACIYSTTFVFTMLCHPSDAPQLPTQSTLCLGYSAREPERERGGDCAKTPQPSTMRPPPPLPPTLSLCVLCIFNPPPFSPTIGLHQTRHVDAETVRTFLTLAMPNKRRNTQSKANRSTLNPTTPPPSFMFPPYLSVCAPNSTT